MSRDLAHRAVKTEWYGSLSYSHPTARAAPQAWSKQALSRAGRGGGLSFPGPAGRCSGRENTGRDSARGSAANCFLGFAAHAG